MNGLALAVTIYGVLFFLLGWKEGKRRMTKRLSYGVLCLLRYLEGSRAPYKSNSEQHLDLLNFHDIFFLE